jgi:hypothetical protein
MFKLNVLASLDVDSQNASNVGVVSLPWIIKINASPVRIVH